MQVFEDGKKRELRSSCSSVSLLFLSKLQFQLEESETARKPLLKDDGTIKAAFQRRTSKKEICLPALFTPCLSHCRTTSRRPLLKRTTTNQPHQFLWILKVTNVTISYNDTHHSLLHTNGFTTSLKASVSRCTSPLLLPPLCTHVLSSSSSCWKKLCIPLFFTQNSFAVYGRSTGGCRLISTGFVLLPSILFTFPN